MLDNKAIIVTGGLGFIGKNVCKSLSDYFERKIIVDKVTYASDLDYYYDELKALGWELICCDINNIETISDILPAECVILNLAAESHVDKSFDNVSDFTFANVMGVQKLVSYCIKSRCRLLHVSTDEVYGEQVEHAVDELHPLVPTNPYSATKAAGDIFVQTYMKCFELDAKIIRANNIFGSRQLNEKLIPKAIYSASRGEVFYLHGTKELKRHFLHTDDFSRALLIIMNNWDTDKHNIYNIAGETELEVREVVKFVYEKFNLDKSFLQNTVDRPFNDTRYMINDERMRSLGWRPEMDFWVELEKLCDLRSFIKRYY